jgi:uncharacterized protein (TIGR02145 family)
MKFRSALPCLLLALILVPAGTFARTAKSKPKTATASSPKDSAATTARDTAAPAAPAPVAAPAPAPKPVPSGPGFTDSRDGKFYRTVAIGDRTWMAQNLDFKTDPSQCYENVVRNCETYGRLYAWKTARQVCPEGWHLPTDEEWTALEKAVGDGAGNKLKSAKGWAQEGNGNDASGFGALPAGSHDNSGYFHDLEYVAGYWTASDKLVSGGIARLLDGRNGLLARSTASKTTGYSVRCAKD